MNSNKPKSKGHKTSKESNKKSKKSQNKSTNGGKTKSSLKRSTLGFEVEFFILNKNGRVVGEADKLLKKVEEKKQESKAIVKECAKNMIEVGSYPDVKTVNTAQSLIDNVRLLLYTAEENNLVICPLATYPGKFSPQIRSDDSYKIQESLFGKNKFKLAGRCIGYHCHYALPWGVFNTKKLTLKKLINSKNKQSLVNSYNFLIAIDPALTTFMQSSPFYQGKYLAKDSRILIYRGSQELDYADGLYSNFQKFGALPYYEQTGTNIIDLIDDRYREWIKVIKQTAVKEKDIPKYRSSLDTNWAPVKVNAHGTLEQRGMDMNHLIILFSVSVLIRQVLKSIQENFVKVYSSDIAINEPFKYDRRRKIIYIPPDTYVKKELQKLSAYKGFDSEIIWYYCKRLISLVKILAGKKIKNLLEPLEKMFKDKKTLSDEIILEAKKLGYDNFKKVMPAEIAAEIALNHSRRFFKEIVLVQQFIKEIT